MANDIHFRYRTIEMIAEGGFGKVYKCENFQNNSIVARKQIPFDNKRNGVPCLVLREISVLKELEHANVVRLIEVADTVDNFHLVFEYLDYDLDRFIKDESKTMDPRAVKGFLFQILQGVSYCHSQNVLHRDLKPKNLLLDLDTKTIKLADFGYARTFEVPRLEYSTEVTTLPYKAPELLLGNPYTTAVDIWAVGCIFAEMVNRKLLFTGTTDTTFMTNIIRMFGVPSEKDWPGITSACLELCEMEELPSDPIPYLEDIVPGLEPVGLDLLSKMLCMIPSRRITACDALDHPYFKNFKLDD